MAEIKFTKTTFQYPRKAQEFLNFIFCRLFSFGKHAYERRPTVEMNNYMLKCSKFAAKL